MGGSPRTQTGSVQTGPVLKGRGFSRDINRLLIIKINQRGGAALKPKHLNKYRLYERNAAPRSFPINRHLHTS
jgi:hypothetical protein